MTDGAEALAQAVRAGDRTALARAITALESRRADRAALGREVLTRLIPHTGGALRIGVSGVPGVGKSTFIETFGMRLVERGQRVAVLAIDPSSARTQGAILGDKTRMTRLAAAAGAFVRPSPTAGTLGGVGRVTRESLLLCEAAGFETIIVETVGVGQSETMLAQMVDLFLYLVLPGGGDELQGIKKGIVEFADIVLVNKADGDARLAAEQAARHYAGAVDILGRQAEPWQVPVLKLSSLTGAGFDTLDEAISAYRAVLEADETLAARRAAQDLHWFDALLSERLRETFAASRRFAAAAGRARGEVEGRRQMPDAAVDGVLAELRGWLKLDE